MLRIFLAIFLLIASPVLANEPPDPPEGGFVVLFASPCSDDESGEKGECYLLQAVKDGVQYVTFYQGERLMFIRKVVGDSYETVWVRDSYNSF